MSAINSQTNLVALQLRLDAEATPGDLRSITWRQAADLIERQSGPAERALKLCRDIQRIYENYGRNAEAEGAAACCNAIAEAYKSAATDSDGRNG